MFKTKAAEKIKAHLMFNSFSPLSEIVSFMRLCWKMW